MEKIGCTSEIKINHDLFCISLDLHYLCAVNSAKLLTLDKKRKNFFVLFSLNRNFAGRIKTKEK